MDNYRYYLMARVWIFKSSVQDLAGEESFTLWVHHPVPVMETLMIAPLVTMVMMLPSPSTPAWSMDLTLVKWVHLLQLLQVPYLPLIHSLEIDSFGFGMIDVSSWSGTSLAAHKWYNY